MRLKATKTSLYKMVAEYEQLPPMNKTEFTKTPRTRSYWLNWHVDGIYYEAYLTACAGKLMLAIEKRDYERRIARDVHALTIPDLRGRGMIDEQEKRAGGMTLKERAEVVAELAAGGFCTHYPGYTCDKDFPAACAACITSWIIRNGITRRDDSRINTERRERA